MASSKPKRPDFTKTLASLDGPPIRKTRPPASGDGASAGGSIDTVAMIAAWDMNVAAQQEAIKLSRQIIHHLEQAEVGRGRMEIAYELTQTSNKRTQLAMYAAAAVLVVSLGWNHTLGAQSAERDAETLRLLTAGSVRLDTIETTLRLVADSVLAAQEADAADLAVAAVVEEAPLPTPAPRRRRSAADRAAKVVHAEELAEKRQAAREARLVASVKVTRAVARLAPDAPAKARAQMKVRKAESSAKAANLDINAF